MLPILYLDDDIVVIHKPSGLLVHRSNIDKYETKFLLQILRDQIGKSVYPVHRLDKPTSGLMIFALNKHCAQILTQSFTNKTVSKSYIAVARGYVDDQLIDYPLQEKHDKMTDSLAKKDKASQAAITKVRCLDQVELPMPVGRYQQARFSLVHLSPQTGRKHQLRRHLAHIRHPIVGDTTHGDGTQNRFVRQHFNLQRLALIAHQIRFLHPITEQYMSFNTSVDDDLSSIISIFDKSKFI